MFIINDSLTVVLLGDWNKLYIQPDWMAEHVFESSEIEIGVNGQGADFVVSYRSEGVTILPGQDRMVFSVMDITDCILNNLSKYLNNLLTKAHTTQLSAYGLNVDFADDDGMVFAEVLDSISDTGIIIENGYEIVTTQISRTIKSDDRLINMDSKMEGSSINIHFNEHYSTEPQEFSVEYFRAFINNCRMLLAGLGYEMEGEV